MQLNSLLGVLCFGCWEHDRDSFVVVLEQTEQNLLARRVVQGPTELEWYYNRLQRAGFTDLKQEGLAFWQWMPPTSSVRKGLRRITSGCAGPSSTCPNGLWRDEQDNKRVDTTARRVVHETSRGKGTEHHSTTNGPE